MGAGTGLSGCIERCWVGLLVGVLKGIGGCVRNGLGGGWIGLLVGVEKELGGCVRTGVGRGCIGSLVGVGKRRMCVC